MYSILLVLLGSQIDSGMRTSVDEGAGEDPPELVLPRHAAGVDGPHAQQVLLGRAQHRVEPHGHHVPAGDADGGHQDGNVGGQYEVQGDVCRETLPSSLLPRVSPAEPAMLLAERHR